MYAVLWESPSNTVSFCGCLTLVEFLREGKCGWAVANVDVKIF